MMSLRYLKVAVLFVLMLVTGCSSLEPVSSQTSSRSGPREPGTYEVFGKTYRIMPSSRGYVEIGIASWYGRKFHGRLTSNGEQYDMFGLTAAHKALPLPTQVRVTNLDNGRKVVLRVNDRGPFHDDRLIDLSYAAARALGFADKGTAPVVVEALDEINYPEEVRETHLSSYYLQVGAFSELNGAEKRLEVVRTLLSDQEFDYPVRTLTSETESGLLYKVWIGPVFGQEREHVLEKSIQEAGMGNAIKVEIE